MHSIELIATSVPDRYDGETSLLKTIKNNCITTSNILFHNLTTLA